MEVRSLLIIDFGAKSLKIYHKALIAFFKGLGDFKVVN